MLCVVLVCVGLAAASSVTSSAEDRSLSVVETAEGDELSYSVSDGVKVVESSDASDAADESQKPSSTSKETKTVKVGYYESRNFLEGAGDGQAKAGYGYEYLQRVASYASWRYEYVYGTWDELYKKLKAGEIDVLPGVARIGVHEQDVLFPSVSMLSETFYVYKKSSDESIKAGSAKSLEDKRVGVVKASNAKTALDAWLKKEGVSVKESVYESTADMKKAWSKGKVDVVVSSDNVVFDIDGIEPIDMLGKTPFYLGVAKQDKSLLTELNETLGLMNAQDRTFLDELSLRYSTNSALNTYLTAEEAKWTKSHDSLVVGYLDDYLPFSATNAEGNATGLFLDVLGAVFDALPGSWYPEIETKGYADQEDLVKALKNGEIDLAFPVSGDTWDAENAGYLCSSPVVSPSMVLVSQGGFDSPEFDLSVATNKIAVNRNNLMQESYAKRMFPDCEIVSCMSIDECLNAVKGGRADCTIINSLRAGAILNSEPSLVTLQLPGSDPRSFAVAEGDGTFLQLLNRGLSLIGSSYGANAALQHTSDLYKYTVADFVRDNLVLILTALFFLAILGVFQLSRHFSRLRRETEREVERNKELKAALDQAEKAGQARDVLLRNLSHDIRTPLNGILGLMEKLEDEPTPEQARSDRDKAKQASNQLLRLVDNLLEMSRLKTGDLELASETFSLNQLIETVIEDVEPRTEGRGVTIKVEKDEGFVGAPKVKGSPLYVGQLLDNVIDNAIRFNKEGGQVVVHAEVSRSADAAPANVSSGDSAEAPVDAGESLVFVCSVKDTGEGMDEEAVTRMFEPFFQANMDSRSEYHGSGLGMPIVRALVDLMGGSIGVSSKEGEGTKVVVSLPFEIATDHDGGDGEERDSFGANVPITDETAFGNVTSSGEVSVRGSGSQEQPEHQSQEQPEERKPLQGVCCLVAEDNELNLELVRFFLVRVGAKVLVARNGREALEVFADSEVGMVDVVLMDIMMPEMDGCESASAIRALDRPDAKTVPIIALTANVLEDDRRQVFESGMNEHLPKPIDSEKLVSAIKGLL